MVQKIKEKSDNGMAKMSVTGKNGVIPNLNVENNFKKSLKKILF